MSKKSFEEFKKQSRKASLSLCFLVLASCASYQGKVFEARDLIAKGDVDAAIAKLEPLAKEESGDRLVYLLDYATALQIAGRNEESVKAFSSADRLAEQLDYHSVSRIAGSIVANEEVMQYKGDTFEKIFINAYLAMNYLELGKLDDALVEARRVNEKYVKLRSEEKKEFELNFFAKYLSAVTWEASHDYDDAYIAYSEAYKIDPSVHILRSDLIRSAKLARRNDSYQEWKAKFPEVQESKDWYDKSLSEIVLIFAQGWGPRKAPVPGAHRFPELRTVYSQTQSARLIVDGSEFISSSIYDVDRAAKKTLQDDYAYIIGKRIAGVVAKKAVADEVRKKNELLGALTELALNATDRADLRQWSTVPQSIQVVRVPVKPGKHTVKIQGLAYGGSATDESMVEKTIEVKSGKKFFINWRSLK